MASSPLLSYPHARTTDVVDDYFGSSVADPYRWMEDLRSAELQRWVDAENVVTAQYLEALPDRDALQARITALYDFPRVTTPRFVAGRWFYTRNTGLQRQAVVACREVLNGPETIVLDPNQLSPDGALALTFWDPAPDGRHLAYGQSEGGSDWSTIYVRDVAAASPLPDAISWVMAIGVAWTEDSRGFFYGRYPEPPAGSALEAALHDKRIYYHRLGTPQSADLLIYARPDQPTLFLDAELDDTGRFLFLLTRQGIGRNELLVKDLGDPFAPQLEAPVQPLYLGHTAAYQPLGVVDGTLYLLTDHGAPNRTVVSVALESPAIANWTTIVPPTAFPIESACLVAGMVAVNRLIDVVSAVECYTLRGTAAGTVAPPVPGVISGPSGRMTRPEVWYTFSSPLHPATVWRFDITTGQSTPFEPPALTFDPSRFTTERVFVTAPDGTPVPMFITHAKDLQRTGANPTMLYGYGGFAAPMLPAFRPDVIAWLERGGVWAVAGARGGGEYGEPWHQAGMRERKQQVFDDMISAAEYLVRERYSTPQTLGIMGESNGGLMVGALLTQRPDLFAVALPAASVMDMLRYHRFTGGIVGVAEFGSAEHADEFRWLYRYSPLHNLKSGTRYPATLVTTADHDNRVVPSHSYKFAAALQAAQGSDRPILLRVESGGSHSYRPTDRRIAELADQWAFALAQMQAAASGASHGGAAGAR
jgi:prolyl oligopeptidase